MRSPATVGGPLGDGRPRYSCRPCDEHRRRRSAALRLQLRLVTRVQREEQRRSGMKASNSVQVNATTGNGETLLLPEPRLVTFKIMGNGPVSAGQITVECCPQNTPIAPDSGSAGAVVWKALNTFAVPPNATTDYFAGIIWGTIRARISTPVTGRTVTVTAVRPEEQQGWRRPS
jgi:hypothetical protein